MRQQLFQHVQRHLVRLLRRQRPSPRQPNPRSREFVKPPAIALISVVASLGAACVHSPPKIKGVAPTPANPASPWTPPAAVKNEAARDSVTPPPIAATAKQLTLADIVDLALRNSP